MNFLQQERFNHRDRYVVKTLDAVGNVLSVSRLVDPVVTIVRDDGCDYFLLRSTDGVSDDRFFDYLNFKIAHKPIKTRMAAATALRLFQCYLEIYCKRPEALSEPDWQMLEYFILGKEFVPSGFRCSLRGRSVQTANYYLTAIQRFLRKEGIRYVYLEEETEVTHFVEFNGIHLKYTFIKDVRTLMAPSREDNWVPNYVSPGQFKALLEIVERERDDAARILLKLMYLYGMRLGECLGLTQEDIVMCGVMAGDGAPLPMLRLRNRPSDELFQHAKLLPVMDRDLYGNLGPRTYVLLTRPMFDELQQYVQTTFEKWTARHPERMPDGEATILTRDFPLDANHYVFRNFYGYPLTDAAWNVRLKKYYAEAGIHTDSGVKEANLSHQLRHGCAMLLCRFLPKELRLNAEQLRLFLRHKRLSSGRVYRRATVYDEYCLLESLQADMARELPFINSGYEALEHLRLEQRGLAGSPAETLDEGEDDDFDELDDLE